MRSVVVDLTGDLCRHTLKKKGIIGNQQGFRETYETKKWFRQPYETQKRFRYLQRILNPFKGFVAKFSSTQSIP